MPEPLTVLHTAFTYYPEVSGVAEVVTQVSERLARRGHEVHVATGQQGARPRYEVIRGVHVHRFSVLGSGLGTIAGDTGGYLRFIEGRRWDVVVMHCAQIWTTDLLLDRLDRLSGGRILVCHGLSVYGDPRYETYYRRLREASAQLEVIIGLSCLCEDAQLFSGCRQAIYRVIPNGVDIEAWRVTACDVRKAWGIGERPWVVTVSNHARQKGHERFFELIKAVRKAHPRCRGTIVGTGARTNRAVFRHFGIKGGCWYSCNLRAAFSGAVALRAGVPRDQVISAVRQANVTVLTSRWEASPLVLLESMAAGTPWVALKTGSIGEYGGGIAVDSLEAAAEATSSLIADRERARALGVEGQRIVAERHHWEDVTTQYEECYRQALNSRMA